METTPPPPPPWSSSIPLFPLIVPAGVNADSPHVKVIGPLVPHWPAPPSHSHTQTSRLRSRRKEQTSAGGGGPAANRWTPGWREKAFGLRPGILEAKADKGARRGGGRQAVRVCVGVKGGQRKEGGGFEFILRDDWDAYKIKHSRV